MGTAPANFGAFTPGVAREYLATAVPRITSTAGNAALTVYDPATTNTGRLMNGTFALTQVLQVFATGAAAAARPVSVATSVAQPLRRRSSPGPHPSPTAR